MALKTAQGKPVVSNASPQFSKSYGRATSQLGAVSKSTNVNTPGQIQNTNSKNNMAKSALVTNKNDNNVPNSNQSTNIVSKSLPTKIKEIKNNEKKGHNKPQPDGEGNQSGLKLPGITDNTKPGQKGKEQTKSVQKKSENITTNNKQKSEKVGQTDGSQSNKKNQQNVSNDKTNSSQKLPLIQQKWDSTPSKIQKSQALGKGQRASETNTPILGGNETTGKNFRNLQTGSSVTQSVQGRSTRSDQPSRSSQTVTAGPRKRKRKRPPRKQPPPPKPQIIEYPAGITSISLQEAQSLLDDIAEMKNDGNYDELADFLYQLFYKCENLETGNYTRTEVEYFVKQFQDFNEGFHYRMESKPRGHALIMTNYTFYKVPGDPYSYVLNNRPGAEIDADNLTSLFTDMGYLVTRRDNIKHWEMAHELKHMAELDHKKYDSFVCVISSHGYLNQVFGCDGLKMTFSKEIRQLANEKCPSLAGKPKMFFLQSCQTILEDMKLRTASTIDFGPLPSRTASTVPPETGSISNRSGNSDQDKSKILVNDVDFLVGYSTLPGQLSYRHELTGSWYLNSLYRNIKENYDTYDMVSILEDVNYDVNKKKEQYNFIEYNQVSMFSSSLRGPLFFH